MESQHDDERRRNARRVLAPLLVLTLAGSFSCGQEETASDESPVETKQNDLYVTTGTTLWNGATSATSPQYGTAATVPVCFAVRKRVNAAGTVECNQTDGTNDCAGIYAKPDPSVPGGGALISLDQTVLRPFIKKWITQTWSHATNLEFTGWGDCPIDGATGFHKDAQLANTIVIQFQDADSTSVLGRSTAGPTVITYNWVWFMVAARGTPVDNLFNLIHEFGHAIGFAHEWVRPGYVFPPGCTQTEDAPNEAGFAVTPFIDHQSIMDKCQDITGIYSLAPGDIVGVQQAYGRKASGSLVDFNGLCADIAGGSTSVGALIAGVPCRSQVHQLWTRGSLQQLFQANIDSSTFRCLNVSGGAVSTTLPTPVGSWTCSSGFTNEQFPLSGVEWRGMGSMCVTAGSGAGSGITMNTCNGSSAQKWNFLDGDSATSLRFDQIQSVSTGLCLSTLTTAGALGEVPVLSACSTTDTKQRFTYPGQGIVAFGNWCLNEAGGLPTSGAQIGLWNGCTAVPRPYNEQFTLSGNIKTVPLSNGLGQNVQQCLDGSSVSNTSVWTCQPPSTSPLVPNNQIWEYYL